MNKPGILVVEDEALIAAGIVQTLSLLGYTVHEPVSRGEDAILAVTAKKPDLILMDIELIGPMNGIETAGRIRAIADIPIIYITANTDDLRLKQAQLTEPYAYLVKPVHSRELNATIEMALYKHGLDRKLKSSKELFRTVIEASPDAIVLSDLKGTVLMHNHKAEILVGINPGDTIPDFNILHFFPPDELERLADNTRKTLEQGSIKNIEYTLVRKDGTRFPVELNASVVTDPESGQKRFITVLRDITERRNAEAALRVSEEKYRLIANNTADYIWIYDMDMQLQYISPSVEKMKGFTVEESMSQSLENMITPASLELLMKRFRQEMELEAAGTAKPDRTVTFETEEYCKSGGTILVENSVILLRDAQGRPVGMQGISRDITRRKQAEQALQDSEELYRNLAETTKDCIITTDFDGVITYANPVARSLVGDRDLTGMALKDFMEQEQVGLHQKMLDARRQGFSGMLSFEWSFKSPKDGSTLLFDVRSSLMTTGGIPSGILFNARDMTVRKQMEEALRKREHDFTSLVENATDMIVRFDTGLHYIYCNPAVERQMGIAFDQVQGKTPLELGTLDEQNRFVVTSLQRTRETGVEQEVEQTISTPSGLKQFLTRIIPERDTGGSIVSLLAITRDITERKRTEDALLESYRRFKVTIASLDDAIFLVDPATRLISECNDATTRIFGYSHEELVGRKTNFLHVDMAHLEQFSREANATYDDPGYFKGTFEMRRKNGDVFPTEHFIRPIRDSDGRILYVVSIVRDITERKLAEKVLRENEERHRIISEMTADFVFSCIKKEEESFYAIDWITGAVERITGFTIDEVIAMGCIRCLVHPDDISIFDENITNLPAGESRAYTLRIRTKSGTERWLAVNTTHVPANDSSSSGHVLGGCRDITESKLAEESLQLKDFAIGSSLNAIAITDLSGNLTYVNPAFLSILGYDDQHEVLGRSILSFWLIPGKTQLDFDARLVQGTLSDEIVGQKKDGTQVQVQFSANLVRNASGTPVAMMGSFIDITERKRVEEELRESEEKFRAIADYTVNWESWFGVDGKYIWVSPSVAGFTGYSPGEILAMPDFISTVIAEEDRSLFTERFTEAIRGTRGENFEFRYLHRNGTKHWLNASWQPIFDRNGNSFGTRASGHDITERKQVEDNLAAIHKRTRDQQAALGIVSYSPFLFSGDVYGLSDMLTELASGILGVERVSVWLFAEGGDELRCINLYERSGNRHSSDLVLKRHEYVHEFDALKTAKYIDAHDALTDPRTAGYVEGYLKPNRITSVLDAVIRHSGQNLGVLCFEQVDYPHHWESDEIAFACQLADQIAITLLNAERKRAEDALRESERKYRNVVEDQTEYVCRFLPDGTHIFINDAYCRYFNRKREEIVGHRFKPVIHPDDRKRVAQHLSSLSPDHPVTEIDQRIIMPDGSTRWQRWSDRAIFDPEGRVIEYQSVGRDITEQKELEKERDQHALELMHLSDSLAAANKKLNLLSSITRHDITNQLTVLTGYLRILEKKQPDASFSEQFKKINTSAQRISAMLRFTKEYEKIGINAPVWQDCRTLADTAAKQAPIGKIMIKNDLPAGTAIFADPLVVRVFYNLMENAIRYGGKITTIRFSGQETGADYLIVCEDDGEGVPEKDKENIFERGFGKNTGLGLTLSQEILMITGITIRETGEPGKGARFEMTVPKGAWRMTGGGA